MEDVLKDELAAARLPGPDRALVQELCYGAVRWRATLDWLIHRQSHQPHIDLPALVILRLGLYQLLWLDRIPPHAAVHETVEAARALDLGHQAGFINAVLRNIQRAAEATRATLQELRTSNPALGWSHPAWLVQRWQARLTPAELQALLAWNNSPAPTYVRINTLKADPARLIEQWRDEGVQYDFGRWDWVPENLVFHFRQHPPLERLKSLQDGLFYVQDPSTLLAVGLLAPRPGERILDLCAAPGGKATLIAQYLDNDGSVIAVDPQPKRRQRLQANCERLGADITVAAPDAPETQGPFDAILIDAPCSNTGVLRRRLEVRWRLSASELDRGRVTQARILADVAPRVRPGGRLVYSTCSLEPEENEAQIDAFVAAHPRFRLIQARFLHPARDAVDGAYAALLQAE